MEIRENFTDFRYLGSTEEPNVLKEYVLYDEAKKVIEELSDELDVCNMHYLSQVSLNKSL